MANTIALVPGAGIVSSIANIFINVLLIVLFAALALWLISMIPGINRIIPTFGSSTPDTASTSTNV